MGCWATWTASSCWNATSDVALVRGGSRRILATAACTGAGRPPTPNEVLALIKRITAVWQRREILGTLVQRDLRVRHSRSVLGYVWTVLDPLLMASVYFVVFTFIFKAGRVADTPYFLYLLSGLLAWQWFTGAVTDTTKSLIQEAPPVRLIEPSPRGLGHPVRHRQGGGVRPVLAHPRRLRHLLPREGQGGPRLGTAVVPPASDSSSCCSWGCGAHPRPGSPCSPPTCSASCASSCASSSTSPRCSTACTRCPIKVGGARPQPPQRHPVLHRGGLFERSVSWVDVGVSAAMSLLFIVLGFWTFSRLERSVLKEI